VVIDRINSRIPRLDHLGSDFFWDESDLICERETERDEYLHRGLTSSNQRPWRWVRAKVSGGGGLPVTKR
jgi:hypothetical protein